ncbi:MAG: dihydrofolate reductase [Thermoanaerobaculia bacterium]
MRVSIIVAVADNGVIGAGGAVPWHLRADLRRFKALTMGHHLIVGRKTWESIGRVLPGRTLLVVSRGRPGLPPGVALAPSLDAALETARAAGETEAFVAGGAELYALALPLADRLYLTRVHATPEGDTFLPPYPDPLFLLTEQTEGLVDAASPLPHTFSTYDRRPAARPAP